MQVTCEGAQLQVWGTLQVADAGVQASWRSDPAEAMQALRQAAVHLCHAALRSEVQHHLDFDPGYQPLVWSARGLGSPASLVHLAARRAVHAACLGDSATPRTGAQWQGCLDAGRPRLLGCVRATLQGLEALSLASESLRRELERSAPADWSPVIAVTRDDRDWLLRLDQMEALPDARFARLPALLQACAERMRRLAGGGVVAVRQAMAAFEPWMERAEGARPGAADLGAWLDFHWLVRESRLGLHAREGGPWPRLRDVERAWDALHQAPSRTVSDGGGVTS